MRTRRSNSEPSKGSKPPAMGLRRQSRLRPTRYLLSGVIAAALLVIAGSARAQGRSDDERRPRPPIRASATVEVIDPARGVDEIISRVRDQKNRRGDAAKDHTKEDTGRSGDKAGDKDDDRNRRGSQGGDREALPPPDSSDRPSFRPDRDRREPRRQDGDARPSLPNTRQRSNHR